MGDVPGVRRPGVIVLAEPSVHSLLGASGAGWQLSAPVASADDLWRGLSDGTLDNRSRVLIFSDSLHAEGDDETELQHAARAIVAMANAGARVVLVEWRPERRDAFDGALASAALAQNVDPSTLVVHRVSPANGGRALLNSVRSAVEGVITMPDEFGPEIDVPLTRTHESAPRVAPRSPTVGLSDLSALSGLEGDQSDATPSASAPASSQGLDAGRPTMPPVGTVVEQTGAAEGDAEYPPQASRELLNEPILPGQVTITVTSSKGGSGKSTASILLAASIVQASRDAGAPLSVCLIDLDTRDGQVASLIGKFMPTALNIRVQPVWDEERIRRNLVRAEGLGVDTLLAPIRPRTADTVGPDFYRTIVRSLQRMYDVIVMDTSVQYLEPLIADVALKESDEILFVTTLASTAVQGMARALREMTAPADESGLGVPREKIGILVNQSVANVGMERDQVLAAGLGVPVVGVVPLATKDVLTATNLNRMSALLEHPLLGPAYNELAQACLPGRDLAPWSAPEGALAELDEADASADPESDGARRRGLFRR